MIFNSKLFRKEFPEPEVLIIVLTMYYYLYFYSINILNHFHVYSLT